MSRYVKWWTSLNEAINGHIRETVTQRESSSLIFGIYNSKLSNKLVREM